MWRATHDLGSLLGRTIAPNTSWPAASESQTSWSSTSDGSRAGDDEVGGFSCCVPAPGSWVGAVDDGSSDARASPSTSCMARGGGATGVPPIAESTADANASEINSAPLEPEPQGGGEVGVTSWDASLRAASLWTSPTLSDPPSAASEPMRDAYAEAEAASPLQTVRLLATSGPIESTPVDGSVLDFGTASSVHAPRLADALPPNSEPALHAGKREASAAMALPSEEPQPLASGEHLEPSEPVTEQEEDEALSAASGVITLCPVGDEPRLRAPLSKSRAQLHAAQLSMQRSAGELSTLRASLVQEGTARTQLQRQVEDCAAAGGEVISPHAIEAVRGALVQLAEGRIHELYAPPPALLWRPANQAPTHTPRPGREPHRCRSGLVCAGKARCKRRTSN